MYLVQTQQTGEAIAKAFRDRKVSYRFATLLHGAAGIGKTQLMKAIANKLGMALINVRVGQLEPGDLIGIPYNVSRNGINIMEYSIPNYLPQYKYNADGKPVYRKDGSHALALEEMGEIVQNREELLEMFDGDLTEVPGVILFLDEVNRIAGDDTKQAIFQLPEQYRMHTYKIPEGCCIFAAANPNTNDYQVSEIGEDKAFMDRFLHVKVRARLEDWLVWAEMNGIDPDLISFYNAIPGALFSDEGSYTLNIDPTPRSAQLINTLLKEVDLPKDDSIRKEVFMGVLGDKIGPMLDKHLRENLNKIPTGNEMILNYKKHQKSIKDAVKKKDVSFLDQVNRNVYAFCGNPENWTELEDNVTNLELYLKDLRPEMRMTLVQQIVKIRTDKGESINDIIGGSDMIYYTLQGDSDAAEDAV